MTEILDSGQRKTSFKMEKINYPVSSCFFPPHICTKPKSWQKASISIFSWIQTASTKKGDVNELYKYSIRCVITFRPDISFLSVFCDNADICMKLNTLTFEPGDVALPSACRVPPGSSSLPAVLRGLPLAVASFLALQLSCFLLLKLLPCWSPATVPVWFNSPSAV